jgi:single-strand DNA-binding protein
VLNVRLATNERRKDKSDQWVDHPEYHGVVIWGRRAEALSNILTKGTKVLIEGGLRTSSWEKDGVKRYKTEIHATEVELLGSKGEGSGSARQASRPAPKEELNTDFGDADTDDIPF